ncbi:MAG TPA: CvpA family protein [Thermoanaerobaculaceae bacterium]|nr:CvpA family protein [Thermoanaerobaculaceae bacterium]HRS14640.1 CvpA family protein [Thermoanaerobaculaceae bacterium]
MDIVLVILIAGCALAGLWWGALRLAAALAAAVAAVAAGRWVAPAAAAVVAGGAAPGPGLRVAAIALSALVAAVVVFVAARGLRKALEALRLGWLDRLAGMLAAGGLSAVVLGLLLALAAMGGHPASSPCAVFLSRVGQTLLAVHSLPASKTSPSSSPATPTSSGQQPI